VPTEEYLDWLLSEKTSELKTAQNEGTLEKEVKKRSLEFLKTKQPTSSGRPKLRDSNGRQRRNFEVLVYLSLQALSRETSFENF
jgi:hypothetical protein